VKILGRRKVFQSATRAVPYFYLLTLKLQSENENASKSFDMINGSSREA
jgi:hypothetical protein